MTTLLPVIFPIQSSLGRVNQRTTFKLHMCSLKSKMCNLKKLHNRLKSSYLKRNRNSNCTSIKIFYVQFEAEPPGTAGRALH